MHINYACFINISKIRSIFLNFNEKRHNERKILMIKCDSRITHCYKIKYYILELLRSQVWIANSVELKENWVSNPKTSSFINLYLFHENCLMELSPTSHSLSVIIVFKVIIIFRVIIVSEIKSRTFRWRIQ